MKQDFSLEQVETLRELINIGVGKGASVLNTMLNNHIQLGVPFIKILHRDDMLSYLSSLGEEKLSVVSLPFKGGSGGSAKLVFPTVDANKLVDSFMESMNQTVDDDSMRIGTLSEIGNIVINSVMGAISNILKIHFRYSIPTYHESIYDKLLDENEAIENSALILAQTKFSINKLEVIGNLIIFFELTTFGYFVESLNQYIVNIS